MTLPLKHRCSLTQMPSDISWNHTAQLPYLNQPFDLVRAEAEEAGFTIEHWDENVTVVALQVRPPDVLIVVTRRGLVKAIGDGAWVPLS